MRIISNGSTFAGQNPAAVEALLRALETATLDPDFEANGQTFVRRMRVGDNYREANSRLRGAEAAQRD